MKTRKLFLCLTEAFEVGMMGVGERPLKQVSTEMTQEKEILKRGGKVGFPYSWASSIYPGFGRERAQSGQSDFLSCKKVTSPTSVLQ